MTVEEVRGNMEGEDRNYDNFPVGMRVLAVDDDPICLKLLEGLLRKCQYHVTTTNQARMALKMLRENRDRFDLVISDVHMPDMDGFKLLELVGLEMDLPVIMLSVNSDPKLVMKGVTHGACDYLVKPIRIEELRNIWQHVIRKKKSDPKKPSKSADQEKSLPGGEGGQGGNAQAGNPDQNEKLNKRRKDDESEAEDNEQDHDDSSTQKKPRVVWSIELHRKFVAAVNQLGIEKAVPKRILDMMNVEGLTRENVASHLQKYRLYLKRISSVASQKAYMVAAIGGKDSAYMRAGSLDGFGDFRTMTGPGRYANPAFTSYTQGAMLGRLNSPAGVGLRNVASSALVQPSLGPSISNSIGTIGKLHPLVSPATQNATLFQGVPSLLELDQLQQNKCTLSVRDYNPLDDSAILGAVSTFNNTRPVAVNSNNSAGIIPNKDLVTQRNSLQPPTAGFVNHSSVNLNTFNNEPFDLDIGDATTFSDRNRHNGDWSGAVQLSKFHSNPLSPNESFSQGRLPATHTRGTTTSTGPHLPILPLDFPSTNAVSVSLEDSRVGGHGQEALGGGTQSMNLGPQQRWVENKQNYSHNSSNTVGPLHLPVPANGSTVGPLGKSIGENGFDNRIDLSLTGRSSVSASTFVQQTDIDRPTADTRSRSGGDCILGQTKSPGAAACAPQSYDSLDDLMNSLIKREQSGNIFDGEIPFDAYAFGSCI